MKTTDLLFREVWEKSFDGMRIVDDQGTIILVNEAFCSMVRMKKEQLIGKPASIIYAPLYQQKIQDKLCERIAQRTVSPHFESKYTLWTGEESWFELSNSYLEIPGESVKLLSIFRDITEAKHAYEALSESEERYHAVSDYMLDLISQTDVEGFLQYVSSSHMTVLEYTSDTLKGKNLSEFVYPEDAERLKFILTSIASSRMANRFEFRIRHALGNYIWLESVINPLMTRDNKNVRGFVFAARDITERKRAEEALMSSEQFYRSLINNSSDIILIVGANYTIRYGTPSVERILHYQPQEVLGKNVVQFVHKDEREALHHAFREVMKSHKSRSFQHRVLKKNGEWLYAETIFKYFIDHLGMECVLLNTRDVTERVEAERELREAHASLEQRVRERTAELVETNQALSESEETALALLNAPTDSSMLLDAEFRILAINETGLKKIGLPLNELLGQEAFNALPSEVAVNRRARATEVMERRSAVRFDDEFDGVYYANSMYPVFDSEGKVARIAFFSQDISDRKRAEQQLRESRERYKRITDTVTDYIFTVRVKDGMPIETIHRPQCVLVTGYTVDEFKSNPYLWITMVHEEDRERVKAHADSVLALRDPGPIEHRIICRDGRVRWVRNTPVVHRDERGNIISYDGVIHNITRRNASGSRSADVD
ncbi:MAG TPA: PAS domain S-box protein [Bacteroidota bacterium]|nr:PAS domain S-box protein [Bacteroidota bacterium]